MARSYGSFIVRYWLLDGNQERIEIEHMQTGDRVRVASLDEGVAWITARVRRPASGGGRAPPDTTAQGESREKGRQPCV
ncbi:hypothetical protein HRbin26_00113 [bacterium HR26]|nr:hypothetical protein HRbin26_00113 [bacterium HR26]